MVVTMSAYRVPIQNRITGEEDALVIVALCAADATRDGAIAAFRTLGWRRVEARPALPIDPGTTLCEEIPRSIYCYLTEPKGYYSLDWREAHAEAPKDGAA